METAVLQPGHACDDDACHSCGLNSGVTHITERLMVVNYFNMDIAAAKAVLPVFIVASGILDLLHPILCRNVKGCH